MLIFTGRDYGHISVHEQEKHQHEGHHYVEHGVLERQVHDEPGCLQLFENYPQDLENGIIQDHDQDQVGYCGFLKLISLPTIFKFKFTLKAVFKRIFLTLFKFIGINFLMTMVEHELHYTCLCSCHCQWRRTVGDMSIWPNMCLCHHISYTAGLWAHLLQRLQASLNTDVTLQPLSLPITHVPNTSIVSQLYMLLWLVVSFFEVIITFLLCAALKFTFSINSI